MVKKLFIVCLVLFYLITIPVYSYATTVTKYNSYTILTESGRQLIQMHASKRATTYAFARLMTGIGVVSGVIAVASLGFNLVGSYFDKYRTNSTLPSLTANVISPATHPGYQSFYGSWSSNHCTITTRWEVTTVCSCGGGEWCDAVYRPAVESCNFTRTSNHYRIGGATQVTVLNYRLNRSNPVHLCNNIQVVSLPTVVVYEYYQLINPISSTYVESVGQTIPESEEANRGAMTAVIQQAKARYDDWAKATNQAAQTSDPLNYPSGSAFGQTARPDFSGAEDFVNIGAGNFVQINEPPAPVPPPPSVEAPPPPGVTDGTCAPCVNDMTLSEVFDRAMSSISDNGLMRFLNKLVLNPSGGKIDSGVIDVSNFGSFSLDLNDWGYMNFVAIIRFVLIGGAFVACYYIIFGN